MDFKNKQVVITGGTTGIGLATAKAFIGAGANVLITSRSSSNLQKVASQINSPKLRTMVSDTSSLVGIGLLEAAIAESGNKIDALFINAGIAAFGRIEGATEADFDSQFNTNVKGAFFTLQKLLPHLGDGSSVVFTASTNATASAVGSSIYAATKAALKKIAQIAANELSERKIRVNLISPGPTDTPGLDYAVPSEAKNYLASITALQRLGDPDEIATAVLFLSSDDASFITGTELVADGGLLNYASK